MHSEKTLLSFNFLSELPFRLCGLIEHELLLVANWCVHFSKYLTGFAINDTLSDNFDAAVMTPGFHDDEVRKICYVSLAEHEDRNSLPHCVGALR